MIFRSGDLEIDYEVRGEGRPMLMLHGYPLDRNVMKECMEPIFKGSGRWKRIYFDLPGMGRSRTCPSIRNSDDMLGAVIRFIGEAVPEGRYAVASESYGGYMARGLIRRMPERLAGVMMLCPMIIAKRSERDLDPHVIPEEDEELLLNLDPDEAEFLRTFLVVINEQVYRRYQRSIAPSLRMGDKKFTDWFREHGYSYTFEVDRLPSPFTRPVLVLTGRQDSWVGYRDAWRIMGNYPRGTFAVIDRAGHGLEMEQRDLFQDLVREWLDRLEDVI